MKGFVFHNGLLIYVVSMHGFSPWKKKKPDVTITGAFRKFFRWMSSQVKQNMGR